MSGSVKNMGGGGDNPYTGIKILTPPTKVNYTAGENFDSTGMVVVATTISGDEELDITDEVVLSPSASIKLYENIDSITISWYYSDYKLTYTCNQAISVTRVLSSLSLTSPTKSIYTKFANLDTSGAVVTATYTSGLTEDVTLLSTFSPANGSRLTEVGSVSLLASYTENNITKTATIPITVNGRKMTVNIDLTNSNPLSAVTYADDAIGMTIGSTDWDDFFGEYPVILKSGVEVGKLNPNNFAKYTDGSTADITSGSSGDVMIAFPRRGLKISTSNNIVTVSMTEDEDNSDFGYLAHKRGSVNKNAFYLGAYKGYVDSSKLRSLSGKSPSNNITIGDYRTRAHNNGSNYEITGFYQLTYLQAMFILKYKNLDSQTALGLGVTSGSMKSTGETNESGMSYGSTSSSTQHVKFCGIEDFWGNIYELIDGLFCNSSRHILTATDSFNDTGSGYTDNGLGSSSDLDNYMSRPQGTTETGFLAKEVAGSSTTYFCDYARLSAGYLAAFGGAYGHGASAGAFFSSVSCSASGAIGNIGARLMYL